MLKYIFLLRIVLFPFSFEAYTCTFVHCTCIDILVPSKPILQLFVIFVCTYGKVERVVWHPGNACVGSSEWNPSVGYEKLSLKHDLQQG
jgi:hypothetical protein